MTAKKRITATIPTQIQAPTGNQLQDEVEESITSRQLPSSATSRESVRPVEVNGELESQNAESREFVQRSAFENAVRSLRRHYSPPRNKSSEGSPSLLSSRALYCAVTLPMRSFQQDLHDDSPDLSAAATLPKVHRLYATNTIVEYLDSLRIGPKHRTRSSAGLTSFDISACD